MVSELRSQAAATHTQTQTREMTCQNTRLAWFRTFYLYTRVQIHACYIKMASARLKDQFVLINGYSGIRASYARGSCMSVHCAGRQPSRQIDRHGHGVK